MSPQLSRVLRHITIILLSLTAAMTLLGGVGTTCVAFKAEEYGPRMAALVPVKPVFQALVVVSIAAAVFGIYSIVRLAKGRPGAFNQTLIFLLAGAVSSAVQYHYSLTLRGSTAPNNMRLYLTLFTLAVFLLMRFLKVFGRGGAEPGTDPGGSIRTTGGAAFVLSGLTVLSTPWWAAPTHVINNANTVYVLFWPLILTGAGMVLAGGVMLFGLMKARAARRVVAQAVEERRAAKYQTA